MTEKPGDYQALRQTLDGLFGGSTPILEQDGKALPAPSITVNGGTVIIGGEHHIHAPHEPARISEAQSRWLKSLVSQIGLAERAKQPRYSDARTWSKLNATLGVDHHRDILRRDFDRALAYLNGWLRCLDSLT